MKPGMTIVPEQSTISASPAETVGATSAILLPSIRTSAFSKSPTRGSRLSTTPPRSRMRRLRPSPTRPCRSAGVAERSPPAWPALVVSDGLPQPAAGIVAAASPAAPALMNSRRLARPNLESRLPAEARRAEAGVPNPGRLPPVPVMELVARRDFTRDVDDEGLSLPPLHQRLLAKASVHELFDELDAAVLEELRIRFETAI